MLDWLAQRAQVSPQKTAMIYGDREWSYATLNREVAAMAFGLAEAGVQAGDHVGVLLPNRPFTVMLIHALARMGAVQVPLNTRHSAAELRWQLEYADCAFFIYAPETDLQAIDLADQRWRNLPVDILRRAGNGESHSRQLELNSLQGIIFTSAPVCRR